MRKLRLFIALVISVVTFSLSAQELPQAINFQAIARDADGQALANTNIMIQLSVIDGTPEGPVVYREIRALQTNVYGGFNFQVGREPNMADGVFADIDWANGRKFLKVDYDPTNSMSFDLSLGAIEFVSVPYAFVAGGVAYIDLEGLEDGNILVYNAATGRFEPQEASAGGIIVETDPTVPAWAKEDLKPTYDYSEILNTPTIPTMPENVSEFNNDAGYITQEVQGLSNVVAINNSANAQIKNVTNPTEAQDAATKAYVDALISQINIMSAKLDSLTTAFGESQMTIGMPTVKTNEIVDITATRVICKGLLMSNGGSTITDWGICWATSHEPTASGDHISSDVEANDFSICVHGLIPNTVYYARAYATNVNGTVYGEEKTFTTTNTYSGVPTGGIDAVFSVSTTNHVYFSQGNLQYQASTNTWRFAPDQTNYIGQANSNISPYYIGWIDLYGWGTGDNPANSSTNAIYYTNFVEWGNNPISNGGNNSYQWRTLTYDEWNYLLFNRTTSSGVRFAKARINGTNGLIILPDNWSTTYYNFSNINNAGAAFTANTISSNVWTDNIEAHGAVFLPASGFREGITINGLGTDGNYWSSSSNNNNGAYNVWHCNTLLNMNNNNTPFHGLSVRLVFDRE